MHELLLDLFGEGRRLEWWQMADRALVMFLIALLLVRLGGVRIFGKKSSFDDIVTVMLGAVLSRGITGAAEFFPCVAAGASLILVHRIISFLCIKLRAVEKLVKGKEVLLFENREILMDNLTKCSLTKMDLMESLRLETNKDSFEHIDRAYMENNGRISFILFKDSV